MCNLKLQTDILNLMISLSGKSFQTSHVHPGTGEEVVIWRDGLGRFLSNSYLEKWNKSISIRSRLAEESVNIFADIPQSGRQELSSKLINIHSPIDAIKEGWDWIRATGKAFKDRPVHNILECVLPIALISATAVAIITSPVVLSSIVSSVVIAKNLASLAPRLKSFMSENDTLYRLGEQGVGIAEKIIPSPNKVIDHTRNILGIIGIGGLFEVARASAQGILQPLEAIADAKESLDANKKAAEFTAYYAQKRQDFDPEEAKMLARLGLDPRNPGDIPKIAKLEERLAIRNIDPQSINSAVDRLEANASTKAFGRHSISQRLRELSQEDISPEGVNWRTGIIDAEIKYGKDIDDIASHYGVLQYLIESPWKAIRGFIPVARLAETLFPLGLNFGEIEEKKQKADKDTEKLLSHVASNSHKSPSKIVITAPFYQEGTIDLGSDFSMEGIDGEESQSQRRRKLIEDTTKLLSQFNAGRFVRISPLYSKSTISSFASPEKKGNIQPNSINIGTNSFNDEAIKTVLFHEYGHLIETNNNKGFESSDYINSRQISKAELTKAENFHLMSIIKSEIPHVVDRFSAPMTYTEKIKYFDEYLTGKKEDLEKQMQIEKGKSGYDYHMNTVSLENELKKINEQLKAIQELKHIYKSSKTHYTDFKDAYAGTEYIVKLVEPDGLVDIKDVPLGEDVPKKATEVVSIGMEKLSNGYTAAQFAQEDRDHMLYTLQAIAN